MRKLILPAAAIAAIAALLLFPHAPDAPPAGAAAEPLKVVLGGPPDGAEPLASPDALAAAFPSVQALPEPAREAVTAVLNGATAPCVPCWEPPRPLAVCALEAPVGCENLPRLVERAADMAAANASPKAIFDAVTYGDPWFPDAPGASGAPLSLELWVDLASPFLAPLLARLGVLGEANREAGPPALVFRILAEVGGEAVARAAAAADAQGALLRFARATRDWQDAADAAAASTGGSAPALDDDALRAIAARCEGLDLDRWETDLSSVSTTDRLASDAALAASRGVRAAPTWFVNGYRLRGMQSQRAIQRIIDLERR